MIDLKSNQVKRGAAITKIKAAVRAGAVIITTHAAKRMAQRGVLRPDLLHAMEHVTAAKEQRGGTFAVASDYTWKCLGPDRLGSTLGFVAAVEDDVIVVTVFDPDRPD